LVTVRDLERVSSPPGQWKRGREVEILQVVGPAFVGARWLGISESARLNATLGDAQSLNVAPLARRHSFLESHRFAIRFFFFVLFLCRASGLRRAFLRSLSGSRSVLCLRLETNSLRFPLTIKSINVFSIRSRKLHTPSVWLGT
jgi:hypothetical protein